MSDGGHMVAPSIGQAILSSASNTASSAIERSDNAHIVPITWHKAKKKTSATYCVFTRRIIEQTMFLQDLFNFAAQS